MKFPLFRITKSKIINLILIGLLLVVTAFLYKTTIPRTASFGCFDDCFNYTAGYLLLHAQTIFKDFFFNHLPFMAYISAGLQWVAQPINVYDLLLQHRQVLIGFGLLWNIFFIIRFGGKGFLFAILYETSKWYLFGTRFLAEGFIVYPLVYLVNLVWEAKNKKISLLDFVGAIFSSWFILFSREPYIPLVLTLFGLLCFFQKDKQRIKYFLWSFIALCAVTTFSFSIPDMWFNLITINKTTVLADAANEFTLLERVSRMILYPFFILQFQEHILWQHLQRLVILFLISIGIFVLKTKKASWVILWIGILALANSRAVPTGQVYYRAFQLLPWYAIFLTLLIHTSIQLRSVAKKATIILLGCITISWGIFFFDSSIFWKEQISPHEELINNFSEEIQIGNAIAILSVPTDDVFIDGWAELIYWQAQRMSRYPYSWYTSVMPLVDIYRDARTTYLIHTPPDFYYGTCPKEVNTTRTIPEEARQHYVNIPINHVPSCLWVYKKTLPRISDERWQKASEFLISKPSSTINAQ